MENPKFYLLAASLDSDNFAKCHQAFGKLLEQSNKDAVEIGPGIVVFKASAGYWGAHFVAEVLKRNRAPFVLAPLYGPLPVHVSEEQKAALEKIGLEVYNSV